MSSGRAVRLFERPCEPPWWASSGQAQTLLGHLLPSPDPALSHAPRRELELPDGDRLALHELAGSSDVRAVLLHGLAGDVDSDYVRRTAARLNGLGHHIWAVNLRNAGSGRGLARSPYHSGRSADLRAVLAASRALDPQLRTLVIGFSLSGNIALLTAAAATPACDAVIAVNPPVDLARAADLVHLGFNRLYELRFVARLRRDIALLEHLGSARPRAPIGPFDSLRTLDDRFTAPVSGFTDASDYYARCSSLPRLASIRVPTVIISSLDDPLIDSTPLRGAMLSPAVTLHLEPHGGHMGYLSRTPTRWLDEALAHYAGELLARKW